MQTCIMAGCDFVKALPGIGIRKAHAHMRRLRSFVKVLCRQASAARLLSDASYISIQLPNQPIYAAPYVANLYRTCSS